MWKMSELFFVTSVGFDPAGNEIQPRSQSIASTSNLKLNNGGSLLKVVSCKLLTLDRQRPIREH